MTEIKFCGMTRPEDASLAAVLGATYVGVVFAGGPRQVTEDRAVRILTGLPRRVARAAVFGAEDPREIARKAARLELNVVQLHADPRGRDVDAVRAEWRDGQVWAVVRAGGADLPGHMQELMATADAILLDSRSEAALGGTGVTLPWDRLATALEAVGRPPRLVLAGGLRAENVAEAIRALSPDVVDVSSGVESQVGIKDPARMRAFRDAVYTARKEQ